MGQSVVPMGATHHSSALSKPASPTSYFAGNNLKLVTAQSVWPPNLHLQLAPVECDDISLNISDPYNGSLPSHHRSWASRHMSAFILDRVMTLADHSNDPRPHHCHFVNAFEAPPGFAVTPYLHNTVRTEIIFSQSIGPAKKNLRLFIEGVKI